MDGKDKFHEIMTRHSPPDAPPPRTESAEAFRNLAGFMGVLFRINERTGLVALDGEGKTHADQ